VNKPALKRFLLRHEMVIVPAGMLALISLLAGVVASIAFGPLVGLAVFGVAFGFYMAILLGGYGVMCLWDRIETWAKSDS
jgi:hypothetical protein